MRIINVRGLPWWVMITMHCKIKWVIRPKYHFALSLALYEENFLQKYIITRFIILMYLDIFHITNSKTNTYTPIKIISVITFVYNISMERLESNLMMIQHLLKLDNSSKKFLTMELKRCKIRLHTNEWVFIP